MVRMHWGARLFAGVAALSLLAAACGGDDDDDATDTTAAEEEEAVEGGELQGMRGTTPAPETTDAVTAFQDRMLEQDAALEDYAYGPETYDSIMLIALAAATAGDDGSAHAAEIVNVSKEGEQCSTFEDCLALDHRGHRHRLRGCLRSHRHVGQR